MKLTKDNYDEYSYLGFIIYEPRNKYFHGDLEIVDEDTGDVLDYAGDLEHAKAIIDSHLLAAQEAAALLEYYETCRRLAPYFIYKYYKNEDKASEYYKKKSPLYYWDEESSEFVSSLVQASFYTTEEEATIARNSRKLHKSYIKYYYEIGNLHHSTDSWRKRFLNHKEDNQWIHSYP